MNYKTEDKSYYLKSWLRRKYPDINEFKKESKVFGDEISIYETYRHIHQIISTGGDPSTLVDFKTYGKGNKFYFGFSIIFLRSEFFIVYGDDGYFVLEEQIVGQTYSNTHAWVWLKKPPFFRRRPYIECIKPGAKLTEGFITPIFK